MLERDLLVQLDAQARPVRGDDVAVFPADRLLEDLGMKARPRLDPLLDQEGGDTHIDLDIGGAEMMLFKVLSQTDPESFSHKVLSLMDKGTLARSIETLDVPVYTLGIRQGGVPTPVSIWKLVDLVRKLRPNILQGWMYHGNLAALFAGAMIPGQAKVVWNIRQSIYALRKEKKLTSLLIRFGARFSSKPVRIIYNSRVSLGQHARIGYSAKKSLVIPNGFDCERFMPDKKIRAGFRASLGLDNDGIVIGLIARYHPMKDHANFLRAAGILKKRCPDVHFAMAGRCIDQNNDKIVAQIRHAGIDGQTHLLGERRDIPEAMAALDIASSSSAWAEAFPNVIGEAMACGVPCVVTDVGDSAWIVGDTGIVVPPQNPEALAKGWETLIKMRQTDRAKLGKAARDRIKDKYSLPRITRLYETLYKDFLGVD